MVTATADAHRVDEVTHQELHGLLLAGLQSTSARRSTSTRPSQARRGTSCAT